MATLSDTPEVYTHFIKIYQLTLFHDPLGQLYSEGSTFLLQARLVHGLPRHLLALRESNASLLVDFVKTVSVEAVEGIHAFQKLCPCSHTKVRPVLHSLPARYVLNHGLSNFRSNFPHLSSIWRVLIIILDESLDGVVYVHRPAPHEVCHFGVGTGWVPKIMQTSKPKSHHSVSVPDGETSVPPFSMLHWLLRYRLQLSATN